MPLLHFPAFLFLTMHHLLEQLSSTLHAHNNQILQLIPIRATVRTIILCSLPDTLLHLINSDRRRANSTPSEVSLNTSSLARLFDSLVVVRFCWPPVIVVRSQHQKSQTFLMGHVP